MRRNALLLLVARLVSAGTTLAMLALVARLRGGEALGAVGIGFAAGAIAAAISDLGISSLLVREAARRPEAAASYLGAGLVVRAVSVPVLLFVIWLVAGVIAPGNALVVVLAAAGLIGQQAADLTRAVFIARQRMHIASAHATIENLAWLGVIAAGLVGGATLEATLGMALLVWLASIVAGLVMGSLLADARPSLAARSNLRELAVQTGPFAAFSVVGIAYSRLDPLFIGLLATGPALVTAGAYFAAARLVAAFEYLPEAVSRAAFPELSRRAVAPGEEIGPVLRSAARVLLAVGLAVPVLVLPSSGLIMATVFGLEPDVAGWILAALACAVPLRYLGYLYGITLTSSDAQGRRVAAGASALLVVVAIDVVGIPRWGVAAPIAATLVAAVLILAVYAGSVVRRFGTAGLGPAEVGRPVFAAAVALLVGAVLGGRIPPIAASLVAFGVYGALLAGERVVARLAPLARSGLAR